MRKTFMRRQLFCAANGANLNIIQALLVRGANIMDTNIFGQTVLQYASRMDGRGKIMKKAVI